MNRSVGKWKLPQPTDLKDDSKQWIQIPRIARIVPFGYKVNEEDSNLLDPIPFELEAIEVARQYVKQYSYRQVANWITTKTGRDISHVGLRKRLMNERQRKNKATTLKSWTEWAEKAIQKAKAYEEERTGAKA